MTTTRTAAFFISTLLLLSSAAEAREFRVQLGVSGLRTTDSGFLILSDSAWPVTGDVGFQAEVGANVFVGARVGATSTAASQSLSGDFAGELTTIDLTAVVGYRYPVLSWFRPVAELWGGASRMSLSMHSVTLSDTAWAPSVAGAAGVEFRIPPQVLFGGTFGFSFDLLGGYRWTLPRDFADQGTDLGSLGLSGGFFRFGFAAVW